MIVFAEFALTLLIGLGAAGFACVLARRVFRPQRGVRARSATSRAIQAVLSRVQSRGVADRIFAALAATYVCVFGSLAVLRHVSFHSGGFDLGIFDQIVWNSLHGNLFQNSISIDAPISLGQHFSPILLALVPLYSIWSDPVVLLFVQTLALAFGGVPLYWFARERLGNGLALLVSAAYFLFPAVQFVNLWDFHEIALATPLLALALYFLSHRRMVPLIVCLFLGLLVKEEIAFAVFAFGLYILLVQRRLATGFAVASFGALWAGVILLYLIPSFGNATFATNYQYVGRYAYLGHTISEIVASMFTQPGLVIQHLVVPAKIEFVLQLLVPLAFVPLVGAEMLALAVPELGYLLIADHPFQNSIRFQYTAPLLPFIFFAAVLGIKRLARSRGQAPGPNPRIMAIAVLIASAGIGNYYFQAPGPFAMQFDPTRYAVSPHTAIGYSLMRVIPPDAPVLADAGLVPHLSHRASAYEASLEYPPNLRQVDFVFADLSLPVHSDFPQIWHDILDTPYFSTVLEQDGYLIKRRAVPTIMHPLQIEFAGRIGLLGYTVESNEPSRCGENAKIILVWRADQPIHRRFVAFVHLVDAQGNIRAQDDHEPANGWLRTDRWNSGDITPDRYTLPIGSDLPQGDYELTAGLYTADGQNNLTARDKTGRDLGSAPAIGVLHVIRGTR